MYGQDEGPLGSILPAYCFTPVHTLWHYVNQPKVVNTIDSFHYQGLCKQNDHMTGEEYSMLHRKGQQLEWDMQKVGPWPSILDNAIFQVITAVFLKIQVYGTWIFFPRLRHRFLPLKDQHAAPSTEQTIMVKMKAVCFSRMLVTLYQTTVS